MKKANAMSEVTMREFRNAPAKTLRRAARTRTRLLIGDFILTVEDAGPRDDTAVIHGCMRATGRIVGCRDDLLSAHDRWTTDA
jgi:hypothetical protein